MAKSFKVKGTVVVKDEATRNLKKVQRGFGGLVNFIQSRVVVTFGDLARAAQAAFAAIKDATDLSGQTRALQLQLNEQGVAFADFLKEVKRVSRGTISEADAIKAASQAILLGIPADKIVKLLEVARASAIATGRSIADAFRDISTGIGRASPLILDNLGIVVKLGPAYKEMADQLGKLPEELTTTEQKMALLNKVLLVGEERIQKFGDAQSKAAEDLQKAQAAVDDTKDAFNAFLTRIVFVITAITSTIRLEITKWQVLWSQAKVPLLELESVFTKVDATVTSFLQKLPGIGHHFDDAAEASRVYAQRLTTLITETKRETIALQEEVQELIATRAAALAAVTAHEELEESIQQVIPATDDLRFHFIGYKQVLQDVGDEADITAGKMLRLSRIPPPMFPGGRNVPVVSGATTNTHFFGVTNRGTVYVSRDELAGTGAFSNPRFGLLPRGQFVRPAAPRRVGPGGSG